MKKKAWKRLANEWYERSVSISNEPHWTIEDMHIQLSDMADEVAQLRDSSEFEARVAAKLAKWIAYNADGVCSFHGKRLGKCIGCGACVLCKARLEVEEEIDG